MTPEARNHVNFFSCKIQNKLLCSEETGSLTKLSMFIIEHWRILYSLQIHIMKIY